MSFSEHEIRDILKSYDVGSVVKSTKKLKDGFQSENLYILTDKGDFVVRIIFDTEKNINTCMRVYEYLTNNGIKTPTPCTY
jgi:hypothetical protein